MAFMHIREIGIDQLVRYASIPIAFQVESVLRIDVIDQGLGGFLLTDEKVSPSYLKDYDHQGNGESLPASWPGRFDLSRWGLFLALEDDDPTGGAAVAIDTPGVMILGERKDIAVLWDIRVHPAKRGCGVGSRLFGHVAGWARQKGCRQLWMETQNVNVPACRFYARQGCSLGAIHRYGYAGCPDVAHEAMLLWVYDLYSSA